MDFFIKHKLMAVVLVVAIAGVGWFFLAGSSEPEAVLTTEAPSVPPEAQQLIASLNALSAVTLDGSIFASPAFQALRDFSTPITTEPVGRKNPFAPLSASEIASGGSALPARAGAPAAATPSSGQ